MALPKVEPKNNFELKPRLKPVTPLQPKPALSTPLVNVEDKKGNVQFYQDQQRFRLNQLYNSQQQERDNSALIGGLTGGTAAQFETREQQVRNTGVIKIVNQPNTPNDFLDRVEADMQKLAPNTTLERRPTSPFYQQQWDKMHGSDTLAIVRRPENTFASRVSGNDQGYRLFDQLLNNGNEVTVSYISNNAYAAPRTSESVGSVVNPGSGSAVDVRYDPYMSADLGGIRDSQGNIINTPTDSAIVLGHELAHASHMQRGTLQNVRPIKNFSEYNSILGNQGRSNVFSGNGTFYRENDSLNIGLLEENRNVGFEGFRYGNEPNENSLRRQLGISEQRISYQFPQSFDANLNASNAYQRITRTEAFYQTAVNKFQTAGHSVSDGVRGSRNSALMGAGFNTLSAIYQGKDTQGVITDSLIGAGTGVGEEVLQRAINGPASTTTGMTNNAWRTAASQVKGAAIVGAVTNTGFAVYDNLSKLQDDSTRSQAVGTIAGEAVVGAGSAVAGAYAGAWAGAAIGSVVPGVGTVIGGVVGFAVGAAAGFVADKVLRGAGVDTFVANAVTTTYDAVSNAASNLAEDAKGFVGGAVNTLSSVFG